MLRSPLARDCPDANALRDRLAAAADLHVNPPVPQQILASFSREAGRYRVELRMTGWREGVRVFSSSDETCAGVAHAAQVALSMVLDPSIDSRSDPGTTSVDPAQADAAPMPEPSPQVLEQEAPPSVPSRQAAEAPQAPAALGPARRRDAQPPVFASSPVAEPRVAPFSLELSAAPGLSHGFADAFALTFEAGLRLTSSENVLALLAFSTLPDKVEAPPGTASLLLFGAHLRACRAIHDAPPEALRLSVCAQASAGEIRGRARGFSSVTAARFRPWLALGPAIELNRFPRKAVNWSVSIALPFPLTRESYVITGDDGIYRTLYRTQAWAFWLGLAVNGAIL